MKFEVWYLYDKKGKYLDNKKSLGVCSILSQKHTFLALRITNEEGRIMELENIEISEWTPAWIILHGWEITHRKGLDKIGHYQEVLLEEAK